MGSFDKDYSLETSTTMNAIMNAFPSGYPECTYVAYSGKGAGTNRGATSGAFYESRFDDGFTPEGVIANKPMMLTLKTTVFIRHRLFHISYVRFGWQVRDSIDNTSRIYFQLMYNTNSPYNGWVLGCWLTEPGSDTVTLIGYVDIDGWTKVSWASSIAELSLEITINLAMMKDSSGTIFSMKPTIIIHNKADGATYTWDDIDAIAGEGNRQRLWCDGSGTIRMFSGGRNNYSYVSELLFRRVTMG
jgi:hypothetical protein